MTQFASNASAISAQRASRTLLGNKSTRVLATLVSLRAHKFATMPPHLSLMVQGSLSVRATLAQTQPAHTTSVRSETHLHRPALSA